MHFYQIIDKSTVSKLITNLLKGKVKHLTNRHNLL